MSQLNAFVRTLTGKNKTGQVLYGFLDVLPLPPVHNLIRLAVKENVPKSEIPFYVWQKIDKLRLSTSGLSIGLGFAVLKGWISMEDAIEFLKIISQLL